MHSAPSVSYPVGRCRFEALVLLGMGGLAGAVVSLWSFMSPLNWRHSAAWFVLGACLVLAWVNWRRSISGVLRWEGGAWSWTSGAAASAHELHVVLDLHSVLLVRSSPQSRWFWLEARRAPSRWTDLRRAVYSRAIDDALQQPGGRSAVDIAP
ncbi:MAG: hypothetical protein EON93_08820 [Burkholderiales bacterium]|nr:MAG: hypothetical protein EON93_08820 [Burkholderiales bacterium]